MNRLPQANASRVALYGVGSMALLANFSRLHHGCCLERLVQLQLADRGRVRRERAVQIRRDMSDGKWPSVTLVRQTIRAARPIATRRNPRQCISC